MKKMMICMLVLLFASSIGVQAITYDECVAQCPSLPRTWCPDGCWCDAEEHQCSTGTGDGPEFSTIGITAIISLAAGGAIGFNIGKKKK